MKHDHSNLPICFHELVKYNRDNGTSIIYNLYHLNAINKFNQKSLRFVGPKQWNNLPYLIKIN